MFPHSRSLPEQRSMMQSVSVSINLAFVPDGHRGVVLEPNGPRAVKPAALLSRAIVVPRLFAMTALQRIATSADESSMTKLHDATLTQG